MNGMYKPHELAQIIISFIILAIFAYQVITGQEINPTVRDYVAYIIGFWFALDRIIHLTGKAIERKYTTPETAKETIENDFTP